MAVDVKTGEERMLLENARIGEIVVNPVDQSLMGVRHDERPRDAGAHSVSVRRWYRGAHVPVRCRALRPRHLPRRPAAVGVDGEVTGDQFLRVGISTKLLAATSAALRVPLRPVGSGELRVLARRPLPVRKQLLHRRVQHLPLRGRDRRDRSGVERRNRFFRPVPLADGGWSSSTTPARASFPRSSIRGPSRTSARSGSRAPSRREVSRRQDVAGPPPSTVDEEKLITSGPYSADEPRLYERVSRSSRATRARPRSATTSTSRIRCNSRTSASPPRIRRQQPAGDERGHVDITGRYSSGRGALSWNRRISTTCSARQNAAARAMPPSSATTGS